MDRLGLEAGAFRQTLGRPARRGAERHLGPLGHQDFQDGAQQRRFAHAWTAGDHQDFRGQRHANGLLLAVGQHEAGLALDPRDRLVGVDPRPGRAAGGEGAQPFGDLLLRPIEPGQEDAAVAVQRIGHHIAGLKFQGQRGLDQVCRHLDQRLGLRRQFLRRQTAMAFVHRLGQSVADAGANPDHRRLLDAKLCRDLVRGAEADAADVACQAVRVLADHLHGSGAVGLVDAHGAGGADAIGMQEQHDLPDHLLLRPAGDDARRALWSDPGHLAQPVGLLFDQVEHRLAESAHQPLGIDRADAGDHP